MFDRIECESEQTLALVAPNVEVPSAAVVGQPVRRYLSLADFAAPSGQVPHMQPATLVVPFDGARCNLNLPAASILFMAQRWGRGPGE